MKQCQDVESYERLVKQLCELLLLEEKGYIKIYYGDESGFSLDPCIPYGWQPAKQYIRMRPKKSKRLNVFGLLSTDNDLHAYSSEQSMNADLIIAFLDDFATTLTGKTVVVLDNASIHHSDGFTDKLKQWQAQGLSIFHLPTYSPHLNRIETLWRKIKYEWLKPHHYLSWQTLTDAIDEILLKVGNTFTIDFKELKLFTQFKTSFISD